MYSITGIITYLIVFHINLHLIRNFRLILDADMCISHVVLTEYIVENIKLFDTYLTINELIVNSVVTLHEAKKHGLPPYFQLEEQLSQAFPGDSKLLLPRIYLWGASGSGKTALAMALTGISLDLDSRYIKFSSFVRAFSIV